LFDHPVTSKLTISYPTTAIKWSGTYFALRSLFGCNDAALSCDDAAETYMKIYLLMLLIGALLTAIHFTSVPEQQSKSLPQ
jgi:hypothetical protein